VCASLAVRQWIERERLTAFTMNFMEVTRAAGFPPCRFSRPAKGMARGIGYAGEGDGLTAALVGRLPLALSGCPSPRCSAPTGRTTAYSSVTWAR